MTEKTWLDIPLPEVITRVRGRKNPAKLDNQYADALEDLHDADAKMRRAFHAYEKAQARVKRLGKMIDKLQEIDNEISR
jgi:uncharacterized protein YdcH (DUF465 family)